MTEAQRKKSETPCDPKWGTWLTKQCCCCGLDEDIPGDEWAAYSVDSMGPDWMHQKCMEEFIRQDHTTSSSGSSISGHVNGRTVKTHRDLLRALAIATIHEAVGGSRWAKGFENDVSSFLDKVMTAIDSVPSIAEEFKKPVNLWLLSSTLENFCKEPDGVPF
jgi:hypothetical protein